MKVFQKILNSLAMTLIITTFRKYEKHPTILHCPLAWTVVAVVALVVVIVILIVIVIVVVVVVVVVFMHDVR